MNTKPLKTEKDKDQVPFFHSWKGWYGLIIGNLVFLIIVFYLFSRIYS